MAKFIVSLLSAGAALMLAGCVFPPHPVKVTPGAEGRVVDSVTRQPIAHAELRFVRPDSVTPFDSTVVTTDSTGRFSLRASHHLEGGVIWNPMAGGGLFFGDQSQSTLVLIKSAGYWAKVVDLQKMFTQLRAEGKTPGAHIELVLFYDGDLMLDDIALEREPD
jgi:hypothetical protein